MLRSIMKTQNDLSLTILRLALGIMIVPHGAQKLLGWFGGGGVGGTIGFFSQNFGVPPAITVLVIIGEFFGGLGLITGFLTRVSAGAVGLIMLGAVFMVHIGNGFFMNWSGTQAGEGFEFHLLAITLAGVLAWRGGGAASVDGMMAADAPTS